MMIHKFTPSVDYNYWLKHLINESTNQNSMKTPKVAKLTNKKTKQFLAV